MSQLPDIQPRPDRRPALALFAGGLLAGAGILAVVLSSAGAFQPSSSAPSATAAASLGGPLVTLPPIAAPSSLTPTDKADGRSLGAADAPVQVEVWADYQCPYCALFTAQMEPMLISTYVETGQVRLTFRDLAFLGDESRWAAVAAALAEEQGKFWPYHDYLFANQQAENAGGFAIDRLQEIASRVGLDREAFDAGLQLDAARQAFARIRADFEADAAALNIHSTPTIVVDGTVLESRDWAGIQAAINQALAGS